MCSQENRKKGSLEVEIVHPRRDQGNAAAAFPRGVGNNKGLDVRQRVSR